MAADDLFSGLRLTLRAVTDAAKEATLQIAGAALSGGGILFLLLPTYSLSQPAVLLLTVGTMALGAVLGRVGDVYLNYIQENIERKRERPPPKKTDETPPDAG